MQKIMVVISGTLMFLAISSCAAIVRPNFKTEVVELRAGQYRIDPKHSSIHFKVAHLGLSTYVGRFNLFDAQMDFDPNHITATRLQGSVDLSSVDTGDGEVDRLLKGSGWFDIDQHPQALLTSTAVQSLESNKISITADLTIRGLTLPIEFIGQFNGGADNLLTRRYTIGFSAQGTINRADFGMKQFSGLVGDVVTFEIFAEFLQAPKQ